MRCKKPKLAVTALLFCVCSHAQIKFPVNNAFQNDVQKVVAAFPHQFASLRGNELIHNPQTVEYASLVHINHAENCVITRYSSNSKPVYTWQAQLLSTEDFEQAVEKYKWTFYQLKGMNVKYVIDQYTLNGSYEASAEERKFTTSELAVAGAPEALRKLRVEVAMQYQFPEWKVTLSIFEKEREDDEPAEEMED